MPFEQVLEITGFCNPAYFYKVFKKQRGISYSELTSFSVYAMYTYTFPGNPAHNVKIHKYFTRYRNFLLFSSNKKLYIVVIGKRKNLCVRFFAWDMVGGVPPDCLFRTAPCRTDLFRKSYDLVRIRFLLYIPIAFNQFFQTGLCSLRHILHVQCIRSYQLDKKLFQLVFCAGRPVAVADIDSVSVSPWPHSSKTAHQYGNCFPAIP